ncbi:hypothetical protein GCM10022221_67170 [Actinocorallia aurea]
MSTTFGAAFDGAPEINLNGSNAAQVLRVLGFTDPYDLIGGEADAGDFLGRVLIAQGMLDVVGDVGRPDVTDGRFFYGGQEPGYLARRLSELRSIAEQAHAMGAAVRWG